MSNGSGAAGPTPDSDDEAALLRPLAFAEGEGLPFGLWVVLARALSGHPWTAQDVSVFRDRSGELLVETQTPEGVAYRLRARGPRSGERRTQRAITSALLAEVPLDGDGGHRDWPAAAPYIIDHLAAHAAAADALDEMLEDAEYLVHAAPRGCFARSTSRARPGGRCGGASTERPSTYMPPRACPKGGTSSPSTPRATVRATSLGSCLAAAHGGRAGRPARWFIQRFASPGRDWAWTPPPAPSSRGAPTR